MDEKNTEFKKRWETIERVETQPARVRKVIEIEFEELEPVSQAAVKRTPRSDINDFALLLEAARAEAARPVSVKASFLDRAYLRPA